MPAVTRVIPTGRPEDYTVELGEIILEQYATTSKSMARIMADLGHAESSVWLWLTKHREFSESYARAREGFPKARANGKTGTAPVLWTPEASLAHPEEAGCNIDPPRLKMRRPSLNPWVKPWTSGLSE